MPKAMTIAGLVVAAIVLLLFGIDLVAGIPFGTGSMKMNIGALIAGGILGYISFTTLRELK